MFLRVCFYNTCTSLFYIPVIFRGLSFVRLYNATPNAQYSGPCSAPFRLGDLDCDHAHLLSTMAEWDKKFESIVRETERSLSRVKVWA